MSSEIDRSQRAAETSGRDHGASSGEVRARRLERFFAEEQGATFNDVQSPHNERLAASLYEQRFGTQSRISFGKIVWAMPGANWYRVVLDDAGADIGCCQLQNTGGTTPFGVHSTSVLTVGSHVLCWHNKQTHYGVILGTVPEISTDAAMKWGDWISQGSNGGFRREFYYAQFSQLFNRNGGVVDYGDWTPPDSANGDLSLLDDLGGGLHIDALRKFFRVDETCGMTMFYMDRLLRLAGFNLDLRTAATEQIERSDEGELFTYKGHSPYPWEPLGVWQPNLDTHREIGNEDVHYYKPFGKYEPLTDDQQPIYRTEEYGGYLGQGYRRSVSIPPTRDSQYNRWSQADVRPGVFSEQVGLDGHWAVQSAHSLSLVKRLLIPIPKQLKTPEDATGDDARKNNYKFSGKFGGEQDHKVQGQPDVTSESPHLIRAMSIQDLDAYTFNWKGLHPFRYHLKDFKVPAADEIPNFSSLQYLPPYGELYSQQWMSEPPRRTAYVDHRYGDVDYYETAAGLHVLPDGAVVIRDGSGCEIRMLAGSLQISAPGDVWLQPGRNVNLWAGKDLILKSNGSIDLTTTRHDIRLKAERHCEIMAGNNGSLGRLLLECQASGPTYDVVGSKGEDVNETGVILRAPKSDLIGWGANVYLRTGGGDVLPGQICLDAAKGAAGQPLRVLADSVMLHTKNGLNVAAGSVTHHLGPQAAYFPTGVGMLGGLIVCQNGVQVKGPIEGIQCVIASDLNTTGFLGYMPPGSLAYTVVEENIGLVQGTFGSIAGSMSQDKQKGIVDYFHAAKRPGNDSVMTNSSFSPRTRQQQNTVNFSLPEVYYQSLARAGAGMGVWTEQVIKYQSEEFMPYPGLEAWRNDEHAFRTVSQTLHDATKGQDRTALELYEKPTLGTWTDSILDGKYPIINS